MGRGSEGNCFRLFYSSVSLKTSFRFLPALNDLYLASNLAFNIAPWNWDVTLSSRIFSYYLFVIKSVFSVGCSRMPSFAISAMKRSRSLLSISLLASFNREVWVLLYGISSSIFKRSVSKKPRIACSRFTVSSLYNYLFTTEANFSCYRFLHTPKVERLWFQKNVAKV